MLKGPLFISSWDLIAHLCSDKMCGFCILLTAVQQKRLCSCDFQKARGSSENTAASLHFLTASSNSKGYLTNKCSVFSPLV